MRTNFDFWYIRRDDDGFITEAAVNYYEGNYMTVTKTDLETMQPKQAVEYVRMSKLTKEESHIKAGSVKDTDDGDAFVYSAKDFGKIKTEEDLADFLMGEIKKDTTREAIDEQDVVKLINK